jgi:hypothetical protein
VGAGGAQRGSGCGEPSLQLGEEEHVGELGRRRRGAVPGEGKWSEGMGAVFSCFR